MASKITSQIAVIPDVKCDLCDNNDVAWKCLVCDELMCHNCKKSHLRSKLTKNHKVVSLDGVEIIPSKEKKCQHHPSEVIERYCEPCQLPVCISCIADGNHKNHQLSKINEVLEVKERELTQMVAESKQKLSTFTEAIKSVKKNQSDFSSQISKCITEVKARNSELKDKLDTITDELIKQLQQIDRKNQEQLKKTEKLLEEDLSSLKELIRNCEDKLMTQEIEMIQFVTQVKQRLDKFKSCDPSVPLKLPIFITREVHVQELKDMFGNLNLPSENVPEAQHTTQTSDPKPTIDVQVISTFTIKDKNIISAVRNDQVWMGKCGDKDVTLVTINGDVVQTVNTDFDVYGMAVTQSGEVLATVHGGNKVKKLMLNNEFVDLYKAPKGYYTKGITVTVHSGNKVRKLIPNNTFVDLYEAPNRYLTRGITVTDDNNMVVCLYNRDIKEGKLVQLSLNGRLINTIQYHKDSTTPLFDNPYDVSSNRNGDLIVRQYKSVVVVDKTGKWRFTYTGQVEGLKDPFDPCCIVTDKYGHIIISDQVNSVIHILDKDGNFIQFILTGKHGLQNLFGLSIDTLGRVWVGSFGNDKVMVVKYM